VDSGERAAQMPALRLAGKVALVVGGGSDGPAADKTSVPMGNGRSIAVRLGAEGAAVAVTDRTHAAAQETVDLIDRGVAIEADAGNEVDSAMAVREAHSRFGSLDIVVCNVGVHGQQSLRNQTVADWDHTMSINARSHWLTAQAAMPLMLGQPHGGVFIFVTSTSATHSSGTGLAYEASKSAQLAVMRYIAVRYADRGIRSNCLMLGVIDTPMVRRLWGNGSPTGDGGLVTSPMGRQGRPAEVAAAAAFLASDDASFVTGTTLVVDGGLSAASWSHRRSV
jgi:NAD(P)-dependent dehydrogenase (short-subunit alcohol dehydrogenase family)